jgi:hypothetical protein
MGAVAGFPTAPADGSRGDPLAYLTDKDILKDPAVRRPGPLSGLAKLFGGRANRPGGYLKTDCLSHGGLEAVSVVSEIGDFEPGNLGGVVPVSEAEGIAEVGIGLELGAFERCHRSALKLEAEA